ncbi:arginase family protein [Paenibacillus sp. PsM32]|uniref:arginase family protein n=1 Tax=Paenibacillus sp. PsM32 TaxID=3030536 RepID=UPI00263BB7C8|nr:arginase family protein [Paenibacillus sp. PsM32]MDN4620241.1 arginase family protein [Paenibacillus sp. PsM32]
MPIYPIDVFEFPTNLGLTKKEEDEQPGVYVLPEHFKTYGLYDQLPIQNRYTLLAPPYEIKKDAVSGILNIEAVAHYALQQAELLATALEEKTFKLMIGGDCSILVGNMMALKQKGTYGLFFLDGHTDYLPTSSSHTGGAVAGLDLAIVTGLGDDRITNLNDLKPYVLEEHVFCVGNREFDASYVQPILNSAIRYIDLPTLRKTGIEHIVKQFLDMVEHQQLEGFFIHFDVDVLNDLIMPAVDSRQTDGLDYVELIQLLRPLVSHPQVVGLEITVFDPHLDRDGIYATSFIEQLVDIFS